MSLAIGTRPGAPRSFFDVTGDMRLLVNVSPDASDSLPITLVVNWHAELEAKRR